MPSAKRESGGQGQFDDAIEDHPVSINALKTAPAFDIREGSKFIDEDDALDLNDSETTSSVSEDDDDEQDDGYDSQLEADAWEESMARVDDEDWEIAEGGGSVSSN